MRESSELSAYCLITYSLSGLSPSVKTKVSQRVYGTKSKKRVKERVYEYRYKGLKDEQNVSVISESTLLLPKQQAASFIRFLDKHSVRYKIVEIWKGE